MSRRLAALALLCAGPALAAVPEKGEGTIALFGGLHSVFPRNADYLSDSPGTTHSQAQFGGLGSFGYQFDEELHFKIEVGYFQDRYRHADADLTITSIPILLGVDTKIVNTQRFCLYGGGGIGYMLNTGNRHGSNEANSTALYLGLGLRWQLGGPVAFVLEDRYIFANAAVDPQDLTRSINVGGNFALAGLMFHFLEAEDHPQHP
jgi:opacity protein-like surface antigen